MIRRHLALLRAALITVDAIAAMVLFELIVSLRFQGLDPDEIWLRGMAESTFLSVGYALIWVTSMWIVGLYRIRTNLSMRGEVRDVLRATAVAVVLSLVGLLLLNLPPARIVMLSLFVVQPIVTVASRAALRGFLVAIRERGLNSRQVLIIGAGAGAEDFANRVERDSSLGLRVMGHVMGPLEKEVDVSRPIVGRLDELETLLHTQVVDEVAVCLSPDEWIYVEPATKLCEEEGRIVRVVIPSLGGVLSGGRYEELSGTPVVTFLYGPDRVIGMAVKRAFDIAVSVGLMVLLSPLLLGIALAVRLFDGSPVLFRHRRVGLQGRQFDCLKFRTMVVDAEAMTDELEPLNAVRGPAFKIPDDPRVTRLGAFLRRTSLDELPQLLNVLRGEMSIVGPRPAAAREVEGYDLWHRRRLSMRPGLTGLWQVSARDDFDFDRRATLDLNYIDRWSLWLDVVILVRTLPALVLQPGR